MRFFRKLCPFKIFRNACNHGNDSGVDLSNDTRHDQRRFSRHWVTFPVIVSREDFKSESNRETTILKDVSGSGALFETDNPDAYYTGQLVKISIIIEGNDDVKARIRAEASVIRIQKSETLGPEQERPKSGVAVQFDRSFEFERIDHDEVE